MRTSVTLLILLAALPLQAKIPPMPKETLHKLADLVVEGTVLRLEKDGKPYDDHCYTWQRYRASLSAQKQLKGAAKTKVIVVAFKTRIKDEKQCDGGSTSYYLSPGVRYRLYLREITKPYRHFVFINWNGVQRLSH